jgi:hypothetical protein
MRPVLYGILSLALLAPQLARAGTPDDFELGQRSLDYLARQVSVKKGTVKGLPEGLHSAALGRALLAFGGMGHTHRFGRFRDTVRVLLKNMKFDQGKVPDSDLFENQALATAALAEMYAVSRDLGLKSKVKAAVDVLVAAQETSGGWASAAGKQPDVQSTIYGVMALKAAKTAGVGGVSESFTQARAFLVARSSDPSKVDVGPAEKPAMARAGLPIALIFTGLRRNKLKGIFAASPPVADLDLEGCYYRLYTAFQFGGQAWVSVKKQVSERLSELANRNRGAKGGASKDREAFMGTTFVARTVGVHARYERATDDEDAERIPHSAIRAAKSFKAVAADKQDALVRALNGACGQRFMKGYQESCDFLEANSKVALDVLGDLLLSAGYRVKSHVFHLMQRVRPKPAPPKDGVVRLVRVTLELQPRSIPHVVKFLKTNPPVSYAKPITEFLAKQLARKGVVNPSTSFKKRKKIYKAYEKAWKKKRK